MAIGNFGFESCFWHTAYEVVGLGVTCAFGKGRSSVREKNNSSLTLDLLCNLNCVILLKLVEYF